MENKITPEEYKEIKEKAKEFYKKIDSVWCPALKDRVHFKDDGFRHLIWRKKWPRSKKEQIKRLNLLPRSVEVIGQADKFKEYRKSQRFSKTKWGGVKIASISDVQFWSFDKEIGGEKVVVVIRQVGNGKKHFLSVFEENEQKTPQ